MKTFLERIIEAGLIFVLAFSPVAFGSVHVWAFSLMQIIVFTLIVLWAIKSAFFKTALMDRELYPVYASILLFLFWSFLQTVPLPPMLLKRISPEAYEFYLKTIPGYVASPEWRCISVYAFATKESVLKFCSYAGVFFLLTVEAREKGKIERIILAMTVTGFFEAMYGLYGYFGNEGYILGYKKIYYQGSAVGTYVNKNHFAGYLGIVVFVSIGYLLSKFSSRAGHPGLKERIVDILSSSRAPERGLLVIAVMIMSLGIVFSLSRMGVFSFLMAFLIIVLVSIASGHGRPTKVLAGVFSIIFVAALYYGLRPLEERYMESAESFFNDRYHVWNSTLKIIEDFPLAGSGHGTFEAVFPVYQTEQIAKGLSVFTHAHNDYLELLSDGGLIGAVPFFFGAVYFVVLVIRKRSLRRNSFSKGVSLGALGAVTYMGVHGIMDFNMHIPANALTLFAASAVGYCGAAVKRHRYR